VIVLAILKDLMLWRGRDVAAIVLSCFSFLLSICALLISVCHRTPIQLPDSYNVRITGVDVLPDQRMFEHGTDKNSDTSESDADGSKADTDIHEN
jgi:hypothetical protein